MGLMAIELDYGPPPFSPISPIDPSISRGAPDLMRLVLTIEGMGKDPKVRSLIVPTVVIDVVHFEWIAKIQRHDQPMHF